MQQLAQKHATHAITGFELTKKALYISSQYEIKGVTLNVLLYLTTCYNSKSKFVYPKQKTIAKMISASERSVVRAIQELVKKGLILVECKYSNKYIFTPKLTGETSQIEKFFTPEKMSDENSKNVTLKRDTMSLHDKEQIKEKNNLTNVEDYKILKDYVIKNKGRNIQSYINWLINNGKAEKIIRDYKREKANASAMVKLANKVVQDKQYHAQTAWNPSEEWLKNARLGIKQSVDNSKF